MTPETSSSNMRELAKSVCNGRGGLTDAVRLLDLWPLHDCGLGAFELWLANWCAWGEFLPDPVGLMCTGSAACCF